MECFSMEAKAFFFSFVDSFEYPSIYHTFSFISIGELRIIILQLKKRRGKILFW